MSDILLSVVIPIYNTPGKKLDKLFDSFEKQIAEYPIEIILVDDGSKNEETLSHLESYQSKRHKKVLVHQKNQGVSAARNYGISLANGRLLTFVDSDDYVSKDYSKVLIECYLNNPQVAVYSFNILYKIYGHTRIFCTTKSKRLISREVALKYICEDSHFRGYAVNKVINLDVIKKENIPLFKPLRLQEDRLWTLELMLTANSVLLIPDCLYYYVFYQNSAMNNKEKMVIGGGWFLELINAMVIFDDTCVEKLGRDSFYHERSLSYASRCGMIYFLNFNRRHQIKEMSDSVEQVDHLYSELMRFEPEGRLKRICDKYIKARCNFEKGLQKK